ncbi:MAG: hypothetical protein AAGA80_01585 [Cyanobacteria bacterium P01_F01_bin.143]
MFYHPPSKGSLGGSSAHYLARVRQQKIGDILREADLVSQHQVELALQVKEHYSNLLFGEILAMQGWLKSETADFFVEEWSNLLKQKYREPLGYYLQQAALLELEDVETILEEQTQTGVRFGTVAVLQGFIKSTTLDFFLMNLFPKEFQHSPFVNMRSSRRAKSRYSRPKSVITSGFRDYSNYQPQTSEIDEVEPSKIIWIS